MDVAKYVLKSNYSYRKIFRHAHNILDSMVLYYYYYTQLFDVQYIIAKKFTSTAAEE